LTKELAYYRKNHVEAPHHADERPVEEDFQIGDDDLVDGKSLKKIVQSIQRKVSQTSSTYAQQAAINHQNTVSLQLRSQYPDIDSVVSTENLRDLEAAYPDLFTTISSNPDLKSKAVAAYTMIKNLGIHQEDVAANYQPAKDKMRQNMAKPRPSSSVSPSQSSPLSHAGTMMGDLTPDMKKAIWRKMNELRQQV
jgi:hypothetical protein